MKKLLLGGAGAVVLAALIIVFWLSRMLSNLPDVSILKHYRPAAAAEVLDKDGNVLTQYYDRKFRIWAPISGLPDIVIEAVVIAEDDTFFEHKGVNYKAAWDALVHDMHKHRFARGGSTITQQMIKNVFLSKEKTITRKVREYVLARKAEEILSKRRILEIYLNEVEWGENIYGIEAASRYYFAKHAQELTAGEAALLAGMLPNPRYYNPFKRPEKARRRQEQVLFNMHQAKLLSDEEYNAALSQVALRKEGSDRFDFSALSGGNGRPCYQHALEESLLDMYGEQKLYRGGMTITTTLDRSLQDELRRLDEGTGDKKRDVPERVLVVKQGDAIRALVCESSREQEVRDRVGSLVPFFTSGYEVSAVPPSSITREQIVLSVSK